MGWLKITDGNFKGPVEKYINQNWNFSKPQPHNIKSFKSNDKTLELKLS